MTSDDFGKKFSEAMGYLERKFEGDKEVVDKAIDKIIERLPILQQAAIARAFKMGWKFLKKDGENIVLFQYEVKTKLFIDKKGGYCRK